MIKEVESKISQLRQQQKEEYYKQKEYDLENWGLSQRKNGKNKMPLIVTDDEYEALIDASIGTKGTNRNAIASILNIASIAIIALGIIIGIACIIVLDDLAAVYFSISVIVAIVVALLFRGVAEAIYILQQLLDMKRSEEFKKLHKGKEVDPFAQPQPQPPKPQPVYDDQPIPKAPTVVQVDESGVKTVTMPK